MPDNKDNPGNLTGTLTEIPATAGGLLRLKALIIAALNCTFRTRYFIQLSDGQNYQGTQEAEVLCGPQGKTVTFKSIAIPGATGNSPTTSNGNFNNRGLWSGTPSAPYMTFDVVQLGAGTASGMYFSTIDNNAKSPDTGIGWLQISSSSGTWL